MLDSVAAMKNMLWAIRGYDGYDKIYERFVPLGYFSESQIQEVLRVLVSKESLDLDEIIGAYVKRKTKIANDLLSVHKDRKYPQYHCGDNLHFVAQVVDKNHKRVEYPKSCEELSKDDA